MPYITEGKEFFAFSEKIKPFLNLLLLKEGYEYYYADPAAITSRPSLDFFRSLTIKGGDDFYYFYDHSIENQNERLTRYVSRTAQYPLIRIPNSFDSKMAWDEIDTSFIDFIQGNEHYTFNASVSGDYIIASPSLKWYLFADREVEIAKLSTSIGLPDNPREPHYGFLNKNDAENEIQKYMKWKYLM